jgi:prepilin-type N-terminal cleavage/methylation domain-containing protein
MRRDAGVTLLEVLIAVTMLSLLSVGMFLSLRIGLSAFARTDDRLMENRRVAGAQRILDQELEGLLPALAPCGGSEDGAPGPPAVLFQGLGDTMTMVSTFSLQGAWRGRPQLLQFLISASDSDKGGMRLLVNESPYLGPLSGGGLCTGTVPDPDTGAMLAQFRRPAPGPNSFVLADNLSYCRFKYLAPSLKPGEPGVWLPVWKGKGWPSGIRVEMAPLEPSPAHLLPTTVTAPIYLYRDPGARYVDR